MKISTKKVLIFFFLILVVYQFFFFAKQFILKKEITSEITYEPEPPFIENTPIPTVIDNSFDYSKWFWLGKKFSKTEIVKKMSPTVYKDCHYCKFPNYVKSFILIDNNTSYVDALIRSIGVDKYELVILSYTPHTLWNKKLEYKHYTKEVVVEIIKENGVVVELKNCLSTKVYKAQYFTSIHCPLKLTEDLKKECFKVFAKEISPKKRDLLTHPIPVRHCEIPPSQYDPKGIAMVLMLDHTRCDWFVEYLEYHYLIGIKHVYWYLHPGMNTTLFDTTIYSLLDKYIAEDRLTLFLWPYSYPINNRPDYWSKLVGDQRAAFTDALHRIGSKYEWLLFVDDDEFIVPVGGESNPNKINEVFDQYKQYGNVILKSWIYSRVRSSVDSEYVIEKYPKLDEKMINYRKSGIQPLKCLHVNNHECALTTSGYPRETIGGKCVKKDKGCKMIDENMIHIAHFWYKKYHTYNIVKKYNKIDDTPIRKFLPELKKRAGKAKKEIEYSKFNFTKYNEFWKPSMEDLEKKTRHKGKWKKFPDGSYHHKKKTDYFKLSIKEKKY